MRLERVDVTDAPGRDRCRLTGTVLFADGSRDAFWFEFPGTFRSDLNRTGDPWLVALAPLAMTLGEPLVLPLSIDPELHHGVHAVAEVWRGWDPALAPLVVEAADLQPSAPAGDATVALFSGGVDSWYTRVVNPEESAAGLAPRIDTLLLVWGADIALDQAEAFRALAAQVRGDAERAGYACLEVTTNLRESRWGATRWGECSHGAFFAAIVHAAGRFRSCLVPSSMPANFPHPWGSHPLTDPLLSSSVRRIIYHGAEVDRADKIGRLCQEAGVLDHLRVCWRSGTNRNCGRCGKCLRTMIGLELHGALATCGAFPTRRLDLHRVSRLVADNPTRWMALRHMIAAAERYGRQDLAQALAAAGRRSRWMGRTGRFLTRLDHAGVRGAYRLQRWLERDLVRE